MAENATVEVPVVETPAAIPAPEAKPADPKSAENFQEVSKAFYQLFSEGREPVEKAAAKKKAEADAVVKPAEVDPKKNGEPVKPEAKPDEKPTDVEPKKEPRKRARQPAIDPVEIASRAAAETADRITERMSRRETAPPAPKPEPATDFETTTKDLSPDQKRHIGVLREMEELYPEKYKGITGKSVAALSRIEQYTQTWMRENPGRKFDADAEEHQNFFGIVEPEFDDADYYDAVAAIRVKPFEKLSKKLESTEAELEKLKADKESKAIEPEIHRSRLEVGHDVAKELDPKILDAKSEADLTAMAESDPIGAGTAIQFAGQAAAVMGVASAILDGKGRIPIDEKAPEVEGFFALKNQFERELKSLPLQDQYDDQGRRFATWDEFSRIVIKNPEEAGKYWFLDKPKLRMLISTEFVNLAKKEIKRKGDEFERTAKARGFSAANVPAKETKPASEKVDDVLAKHDSTPPPAAAGRTPIGTTSNQDKAKSTDWRDNLLTSFAPR